MAAANAIDHFGWYQKVGALSHFPDYQVHAVLAGLLLIVGGIAVHGKLSKTRENVVPDKTFSLKNFFELSTEFVLSILKDLLGHDAAKHAPMICSVFLFVLVSNLLGLVPGFLAPTASLNTNLAISLTVFVYYNYMGFREHGMGYLKHFMGPILWLAPLIFVIEMIGNFIRPVSLSLRLFGNMMGDHTVFGIFSDLIPIGVPVIFLLLGLFICFIQAFVFALLSTIYLALATAHEH